MPVGREFLRLEGISFGFPGAPHTLDRVDLTLATGHVHCILGRSGCGKTTLLKLAAGLLRPQAGSIAVQGRPGCAAREDVGFVFQQPTLLEWRSVLDNVLLPVMLQRRPTAADHAQAMGLLAQLGLAGLHARHPQQLSGGQQSRVALARALVLRPALLLLDEPFAALDALTREELQQDLLALSAHEGTTALFVTHDIAEAVFLADHVSVMDRGSLAPAIAIDLPRPRTAALRSSADFAALGAQVRQALEGART